MSGLGRAWQWLPFVLLASCGGRSGCGSERAAGERTARPAATSPDPALPGVGAPDRALVGELQAALAAKGSDYVPRTSHSKPDGSPKYTNRLIREASPYLLQHAHNPVSWHAWGEEAFARARREGKPVLLSVGYSTCHWCHVMERESFEDEAIAAFINRHFIAIKVDREERPDVDDVYMAAVQALTGSGGWPMTLALTPEREPFFGGTYFPARDGERGARKGFLTILGELAAEYAQSRAAVVARAGELSRQLRADASPAPAAGVPDAQPIARAVQSLAQAFDPAWGGFGRAPKFPRPVTLELLLRYQRRTGDARSLEMVVKTLEGMARGGVYDHVGGGFHRYATDARWLVPHFEKMLYDNAQLVGVYLSAYQITGRADFAAVARETLDYVAREMTAPAGGFYSATDADSPTPAGGSEEGWFFTWTPAELELALGPELAPKLMSLYGVTPAGNFEGRSILHLPRPFAEAAKQLAVPEPRLRAELATAKGLLYEARRRRAPPLRDDKLLTSWNGLMISAFARAALVFADAGYRERAERAATFVLRELRTSDAAALVRTRRGSGRELLGYLDDHAFFVQALLDLFEASSAPEWLEQARALQATLDRLFWDDAQGGYFATSAAHEQLLTREKPSYDGAEPAGNSVAILSLLRLAELTSDEAYRRRAERALSAFAGELSRSPSSSPLMLAALESYLDVPREVFLLAPAPAPAASAGASALLAVVRRSYLPNRLLVQATEGEAVERLAKLVPALAGKRALGGRVTAYVCEHGSCERPTSDPALLARQLQKVAPLPGPGAN